MQTHFSYMSFYPIAIMYLIYCLFFYLGLVHFIKSYNYQVDFIMIAITINYLDWLVYYNAIVKLVALMLFKSIYY